MVARTIQRFQYAFGHGSEGFLSPHHTAFEAKIPAAYGATLRYLLSVRYFLNLSSLQYNRGEAMCVKERGFSTQCGGIEISAPFYILVDGSHLGIVYKQHGREANFYVVCKTSLVLIYLCSLNTVHMQPPQIAPRERCKFICVISNFSPIFRMQQ